MCSARPIILSPSKLSPPIFSFFIPMPFLLLLCGSYSVMVYHLENLLTWSLWLFDVTRSPHSFHPQKFSASHISIFIFSQSKPSLYLTGWSEAALGKTNSHHALWNFLVLLTLLTFLNHHHTWTYSPEHTVTHHSCHITYITHTGVTTPPKVCMQCVHTVSLSFSTQHCAWNCCRLLGSYSKEYWKGLIQRKSKN